MSKDPAFLFYSSDFLTGVSDLTFEERGQYITLLCLQHQKGHLSGKAVAIAVPNAAADVLAKFTIDEDGNYFNPRLELEAKKRADHSEKQRQRAIDGWKKRKSEQSNIKESGNAAALPLEDESEVENEDKKEDESEVEIWPTFEDFWAAYDKKIGSKEKCKKKFDKLDQDIKEHIMNHIFDYVKSTPDKQYRVNPETFFNQKRWENEIIENNGKGQGKSFGTKYLEHLRENDPDFKNY